uniref:DUF676 domain-containing protein n=1 Tax=Aegilops tauschii subsp. strangulata TaxID=200361 RepID=A0A453RT71_AEGTS
MLGGSHCRLKTYELYNLCITTSGFKWKQTDSDDGRRPLLLQMVQDHDDIKFRSGLRSFKRRVAYANANFDRILLTDEISTIWWVGEHRQSGVNTSCQNIAFLFVMRSIHI